MKRFQPNYGLCYLQSSAYIFFSTNLIFTAELGNGHNMTMLSLGDKDAMLAFTRNQSSANKNVNLEFTLLDNKTGKIIQHSAYLVTI